MTKVASPEVSKGFTGGCRCGAVRYAFPQPLFMGLCYCRDCQHSTGTSHAPVIAVLSETLDFTGTVRWYDGQSACGNKVQRGFCVECGTPLIGRLEKNPGANAILAGTLDNPSLFQPAFAMWTASAPSWVTIDHNLPSFQEQPPETGAMYDSIRR